MTRFKVYAREKGVALDCDYECLPAGGLDSVYALPDRAAVLQYHYCYGWTGIYFRRDGSVYVADPSRDDVAAALNRGRDWWDCVDPEEVQL